MLLTSCFLSIKIRVVGVDGPGIEYRPPEQFFFLLCKFPDRLWGPLSLLFNGHRCSLDVKRPGREVDHSRPCGSEVKNE